MQVPYGNKQEWESGLPEPFTWERWMAWFYVYVDDSGKEENLKDRFISLCGYLVSPSNLQKFSTRWNEALQKYGVPPIHLRSIRHPERDEEWAEVKQRWGDQWEIRSAQMLQDFALLVEEENIYAVGAVVDCDHYRSLADSLFKRSFTALSFAFKDVIFGSLKKIETVDPSPTVSFVFDDDRQYGPYLYELMSSLKQSSPKVKERVISVCFSNDQHFPPLQAADMLAGGYREFIEALTVDPAPAPSEVLLRLTKRGYHHPNLYDSKRLDLMEKSALAAVRGKHDADFIDY